MAIEPLADLCNCQFGQLDGTGWQADRALNGSNCQDCMHTPPKSSHGMRTSRSRNRSRRFRCSSACSLHFFLSYLHLRSQYSESSLLRDQRSETARPQSLANQEAPQPSPASPEQSSRLRGDCDINDWYHRLASATTGQVLSPPVTGSRTGSNASPAVRSESHIHDILPGEGQRVLEAFRDKHMKSFPFFYFPPDMTAMDLQNNYPMLWMIIQATCAKSPTRQVELGVRYKEIMARKVIVEGERDIDLLLSVIVYCSW